MQTSPTAHLIQACMYQLLSQG